MDPQFEELAGRITKDVTEAVKAHVTDVLAAAEQRLVRTNLEALTAAERRLSKQARVNVEAVKSEGRLAAEGYAATLESIERELKDFRSEWRAKTDDIDRVLSNHVGRIEEIEKTRQAGSRQLSSEPA